MQVSSLYNPLMQKFNIVYRYEDRCRYAHGNNELRQVKRSVQYKTKRCRSYDLQGSCAYGVRCTFIHEKSNKPPQPQIQSKPSTTIISPASINYISNVVWGSMSELSSYEPS
jgi:hypothetical protein